MSDDSPLKTILSRYTRLDDWLRECVICPARAAPGCEHMERAARAYLVTYLNGDLEGQVSALRRGRGV